MASLGTAPVAVVVNYQSGSALLACVEALTAAVAARELSGFWVIDNASTDGSLEAAAVEDHGGHAVRVPVNLGFARAVNYLARLTAPADLLLVNPDAVLLPGAAPAMAQELAQPNVAAVGGAVIRPDGAYQPSAFPAPDLGWAVAHLFGLRNHGFFRRALRRSNWIRRRAEPYLAAEPGRARDCDWVVGSCLLLRRSALEEIGGLDEQFFLYYEEIDWCTRARQAGWRVRFLPVPAITHEIGRSAAFSPPLATAARYSSMTHYFAKHRGKVAAAAIRLLIAAVFGIRLVVRRRERAIAQAVLREIVKLK